MKLNVLLISVSAPPKSGAESLQTAKYSKFLSNYVRLNLVTSTPGRIGWKKIDEQLLAFTSYYERVVELRTFESNAIINFISRFEFMQNLMLGDSSFLFASKFGQLKNSVNKPDIVYSRSMPFSSARLALRAKRFFNVPWVLHLSDPLSFNPYHKLSEKSLVRLKSLEEECLSEADLISFTSQRTLDAYVVVYSQFKDKFAVFPNVIEPGQVNSMKYDDRGGDFRIVFTGNLYKDRNGVFVLLCFKKLYERKPELFKNVRICLAGNIDEPTVSLVRNEHLYYVDLPGPVSYTESIQLQQTASCLLAIDKPVNKSADGVFFPSKLLDYMAARKFILAITDYHTATRDFVQDRYGKCFSYSEGHELVEFIERMLTNFQQGRRFFFNLEPIDETYFADYQAKRLSQEMIRLCKP